MRSAAHLEAFLIKQGVLFLARLCFRRVQRRACAIAHLMSKPDMYMIHAFITFGDLFLNVLIMSIVFLKAVHV